MPTFLRKQNEREKETETDTQTDAGNIKKEFNLGKSLNAAFDACMLHSASALLPSRKHV